MILSQFHLNPILLTCFSKFQVRDSSVGIAARYGLGDPGMESRWGARFSAPVQTGPGTQTVF